MPKANFNRGSNWKELSVLMTHRDATNYYELLDESVLVVFDIETREFKYLVTERCTCPAFVHGKLCKHRKLRQQMLAVYVEKLWGKNKSL